MRILDDEFDKKLDSVMLLLTRGEMRQLIGYAEQLLEDPNCDHVHLSDEDYKKEVTLCIYDPSTIQNFDARTQKLILKDE